MARGYYSHVPSADDGSVSQRPPTLLALPSYLAGSVSMLGNRPLVAVLKHHGLGLPQYAVLVALWDFGPLAPHELASRLRTDRSHISTYVEALLNRDLVLRVPDSADRRRVTVNLTDEGRVLVQRLMTAAATSQASFLNALTDAEQGTLRTLLMKVMVAAESRPASADPSD